jgi:hypothetical protein
MFDRLTELAREIGDLVSRIRREGVNPVEGGSLLTELGRIENSCASARVFLSGLIAESQLWERNGERSAAHWVARTTQTTVSKAADTLETAKRAWRICPGRRRPFRREWSPRLRSGRSRLRPRSTRLLKNRCSNSKNR